MILYYTMLNVHNVYNFAHLKKQLFLLGIILRFGPHLSQKGVKLLYKKGLVYFFLNAQSGHLNSLKKGQKTWKDCGKRLQTEVIGISFQFIIF